MKISSPKFSDRGIIPSLYTCEGKNIHPPLVFSDVPTHAKSLVLIMDDPDVPKSLRPDGMYDHWIVFNMAPTTHGINEQGTVPGLQGKNTAGSNRYTGPCPPDREHRYFFKLYALDAMLDLDVGATKPEVEQAMEGHILKEAHMIGLYEKNQGY
jgi:Raf kinase inhibitor-like YbhB/YbcL family protein